MRSHIHTESVIRIILKLPWWQLGNNHKPGDASRVRAPLNYWGALDEAVAVLPSQFIDLTVGNFLEPLEYSWKSSYEYGLSLNFVMVLGNPLRVRKTASSPLLRSNIFLTYFKSIFGELAECF